MRVRTIMCLCWCHPGPTALIEGARKGDAVREEQKLEGIAEYARIVMARVDILGSISEEEGRLTRRFATPAMREVNELVSEWMQDAGMAVRQDNIGNLIGRYSTSPRETSQQSKSVLVLGSHLDTVRDAGKYDGPLGVLVAIACVQRMKERGVGLPFDLEVVAFADEEGLRYHTAYLGSKGYLGVLDPGCLDLKDTGGICLMDAASEFGCDPSLLPIRGTEAGELLGYCEVHIEQGPVLEREGLPVGVVSAISGQTRISVRYIGEAGHAGTVPMEMRRDALCAAAELVLIGEGLAREGPRRVGTAGEVEGRAGDGTVIAGADRL